MLDGFKQFLLRGNVVDLAIGVVIGASFTNVVNAFVKSLLTPLLAAVGGEPDFSALYFTINNSKFMYGEFINAVLSFVILAAVVYFLVVLPVNALIERVRKARSVDPTTRSCPECLSEIPTEASRCFQCTSVVVPVQGAGGR
ncbi:MAG: large conductance mechanosensitive channel protein MscL [Gemmatimonadaceae bacterium]|nr:large conductance mechanosensitive channel protein MscL [Gloeobacterales cyanobacterium ES-bin-141]